MSKELSELSAIAAHVLHHPRHRAETLDLIIAAEERERQLQQRADAAEAVKMTCPYCNGEGTGIAHERYANPPNCCYCRGTGKSTAGDVAETRRKLEEAGRMCLQALSFILQTHPERSGGKYEEARDAMKAALGGGGG